MSKYVYGDFQRDNLARRVRIIANVLLGLACLTVICVAIYAQWYMGGN